MKAITPEKKRRKGGCWPLLLALLVGCWSDPSAHTFSRDYSLGDAPLDPPQETGCNYDDLVTGAMVYKTHCARCHNGRPLGERPFAWNEISATHMREQAYLTGKEFRAVVKFMRRWADVGPATPEVEPTVKRFFFSQPISELRAEKKDDARPGNALDAQGTEPHKSQTVERLPPAR